ncbi:MAG: hypothetical protein R3242_05490 [Akkermansiaceae bacterium]|nr:hypothetical protein [Akkermansiaceae bacterium]
MKPRPLLCALFAIHATASAGTTLTGIATPADPFAAARRPMTNTTLFDLALPTTNIHPFIVHHRLPSSMNTELGNLAVDGDVQLYALQFEIALNERLSIVATKDGYVEFDPDSTFSEQGGFANLGLGLKYAFLYDPANRTVVSASASFEIPTGNSDVLQGEGDGLANLMVTGLKLVDEWQFAGAAGVQLPFGNEQSTMGWLSAHASYQVCELFIPLLEMNWYHVLDPGDGTGNYPGQVAGNVPAVARFEGGDLFNLGSTNSYQSRDMVTAAVGFRSRLSEAVDVGCAYEIPLTPDDDSVMKDRVTLDLVWKF